MPSFDSSTRQAYGYLSRARETVLEHDPSCHAITRQDETGRAAGAPDRQLLRIFGVLELPASAAPVHAPTDGPFGQVFVSYARIATRLDGASVVVYPIHESLPGGAFGSAHCDTQTSRALKHEVRHATTAARDQALRVGREVIAGNLYALRHRDAGICIGGSQGAQACSNLLYVYTQGLLSTGADADAYLVPNGVAEITVQYRSQTQTINAKVVNNIATWHSHTTEPQRITWRTAAGQTIKTVIPG